MEFFTVLKFVFASIIAVISLVVFVQALRKCQQDQFFSDTFSLGWLGIFVWGDALVLAPFWLASSLAFFWLSWIGILRWWLLFYLVREFYEVIYWLNHQATNNQYRPPFLRQVKWLTTHQVSIIYQVLSMCQVILAAAGLLLTYGLL